MRHIEMLDKRVNHIIVTILHRLSIIDNFNLTSPLLSREDRAGSEQKNIPVGLPCLLGRGRKEESLPTGKASFLWKVLWWYFTTAQYLGKDDAKIVLIIEFIESMNIW